MQRQTRGAMIRSKARWHNEGEKNTKYFLNLEKRHFNTKTIRQLQLENSSVIKTDEEILTEAKSFYQNLYASRAPDISAHDALQWMGIRPLFFTSWSKTGVPTVSLFIYLRC